LLSGASADAETPALAPPLQELITQSSTIEPLRPETLLRRLSRRSSLLDDLLGLRPWLSQLGVTLSISETSEVLGNVTGGVQRGVAYDGLTQFVFQLDTQSAFSWHGGTFNVSALQIHGRNLSADNLSTLQTASGIEGIAQPAFGSFAPRTYSGDGCTSDDGLASIAVWLDVRNLAHHRTAPLRNAPEAIAFQRHGPYPSVHCGR
jgi:Carbohydrate-selective porin, OprB family